MSDPGNRTSPIPVAVLDRFKAAVGAKGWSEDPQELAALSTSWRDNWRGWTPLVVKPDSTGQVAEVLRICHETGTPVVPQGGNTGLTGASQPHDDGSEIILSTGRLNRIRGIDVENDTIAVEAGCVLADIQAAADGVERLFPLSLAAEGSCQIGGNLATNAGGTQVLRYGNARNLVLGLEVVLPDGRVWDGLRGLRKDNTGYDLKQLFIGCEGTLGVITAAVLKLFPKPSDRQTALVALADPAAAVALLGRMRRHVGEQVTGFELMQRRAIEFALDHVPGNIDPFAAPHPWYVLIQLDGQGAPDTLRQPLEATLFEAAEAGEVLDAVVAGAAAQAQALWKLRESIPEAQNHVGVSVKHDVSVPLSRIPEFIARADRALEAAYPGIRTVAFGHIGDGNIHYNPAQPEAADPAQFQSEYAAINRIVHDLIAELDGSISAEHGLGRLRRGEAYRYKPALEMELMRTLKTALDPGNILNPGKLV